VFGSTKVKLDNALVAKIRKYAAMAGYSSPDEFITHALEKEIARIEEAQSEDEITKRLKGLGYLS
jgi:metal-responsive CopG/Arc/MetJ family transcriptional regulator